jgi:hypothetical protein
MHGIKVWFVSFVLEILLTAGYIHTNIARPDQSMTKIVSALWRFPGMLCHIFQNCLSSQETVLFTRIPKYLEIRYYYLFIYFNLRLLSAYTRISYSK